MPEQLKDVTNPITLASIAVIVGGVVRVLRTKKVGDLLDAMPFTKRIPAPYLPWLAVALGMVLAFLDAKFNAGLSWRDALLVSLAGILAGGTAVAGHETIAKTVGRVRTGNTTPPPPPTRKEMPASPSIPPAPPSGLSRVVFFARSLKLRVGLVLTAAMAVLMLTMTSGCATVAAALPHIIAAIVDGGAIIDRIADYLAKWFALHPDPIIQPKVELAIAKARKALSAALHAAEGADKLDQAKVDAAFDDFKKAYLELIALARPYGVNMEGAPLQVSPEGTSLVVPEPLALKPVKR